MYFEKTGNNKRESWLHVYEGAELYEAAERLRDQFRERELKARKSLALLIADPDVRRDDERIIKSRDEIETCGREYEACKVLANEFRRMPGRDFSLSMGDVVYFGLCDEES